MSQTSAFETPWYVNGLRRLAARMSAIADDLDRAFKPDTSEQAQLPVTEHERILARAAEESLADTRYRLTRYY